MEEVADDSLDSKVSEGLRLAGDSVPSPDGDVVCQLCQEDKHFLGDELALVAMGDRETLLVSAVLRFEAATTPVIGVHGCCEHGSIGRIGRLALAGKTKQVCGFESCDQHDIPPSAILLGRADRDLTGRAGVGMEGLHPADLAAGDLRIDNPSAD